jgi:UDP-N-acetyl-alpha-D-muramoyl-L-alanyl-L-glutamate epimerase
VSSFTFGTFSIDTKRSIVTFNYRVEFKFGIKKTFIDKLYFNDISPDAWDAVPETVLTTTLQSLLIMLGINYWSAFRTSNIKIEGFTLTREQAHFWDTLYLNGLAEFFYLMKIDFRNLIKFPYDDSITLPVAAPFTRSKRALLLNGAGKDSILSAEMLKKTQTPFDFFSFAPTPAHKRIASLVGARNVFVTRRRDSLLNIIMVGSYPSVSTYTFIGVLVAELCGYDSIVTSNERSADFGNLEYLGLQVNHQWCKSTEAEKMINEYIQLYITPSIRTHSLLRELSEIQIVSQFVTYPKYLYNVTSCNTYFWLPPIQQKLMRTNYWCNHCPKCIFLFACFSAYLPKDQVISIFGANLYTKKALLPKFRRILGIEGTKPLDCVGEPGEMILAMHLASKRGEYTGDTVMRMFEEQFPVSYDFDGLSKKVFAK